MQYVKATTTEGATEYFNLSKILNFHVDGDRVKILMGAGLHWWVWADSIKSVNINDIIGGKNNVEN